MLKDGFGQKINLKTQNGFYQNNIKKLKQDSSLEFYQFNCFDMNIEMSLNDEVHWNWGVKYDTSSTTILFANYFTTNNTWMSYDC